jgi:L-alanine-DL-glutamate epimerase-like enolase superfamily enzyme
MIEAVFASRRVVKSRGFGPLALRVEVERFPLKAPFRITRHTLVETNVITVTLQKDGATGRGEAAGVYYRPHDDALNALRQIEAVRGRIEAGIDRESLQRLLPYGGARNAVDCALWDLEAKLTGRPAWEIAGLGRPRPLLTTFTVSAKTPEQMAADALAYTQARAIKLKLTGDAEDADRVRAVRAARPDAWLGIDANQGFTRVSLEALMPVLVAARVVLIEQPLPVGQEEQLDGFESPIYLAADESAQCSADLPALAGRFHVINIKLDKCGGLTEGLAMARCAAALGFEVMVGNMLGTSLAMAPAVLIGQLCTVVDLDGPIFLEADRAVPVVYEDGLICSPEALWGAAR